MRRYLALLVAAAVVFAAGFLAATKLSPVQAKDKPGSGFAAAPGEMGVQDVFGPYEVVKGWPKNISTVAGNEKWTWGAGQSVYAESPNRIFLLFRGELPNIPRPETKLIPEFGPSLQFPIGRLPWRDATVAALPGAGGSGQDPDDGPKLWRGTVGVDAKWEHCLTVVDANGNIVEQWTQWDKIFKRPHFIAINPYDPEKHVWVVDDHMHAIYKFSHDGKTLVQTIGTPTVKGADGTHFNRPTFLNWLPDSTLFVSDGYNGTRVAKFDKDGKFLLDWGMKGTPPNEKRPYYMNNVHGMALDPQTRHVFVNDRANHRIQVFDENGKFLYDFSMGQEPSDIHLIYIGADRTLWAFDRGTSKMLKYDLEGHFLYSFGTWGDFPGGFWGVHGFSVDQEGNFYVAEVDSGRVQKFVPRQAVNSAFLVSKPVYSAWK
jgi:6-phosphogluconolactonase (cycloisomerase 2 family)